MISKETLDYGAYQVVVNCLRTQPSEKVCITTDEKTLHIAEAIKEQFLKITDKVKLFKMEDYGQRPEDGTNALVFPEEIGEYLKTSDVSVYAAMSKKGELQTFRVPMLTIIDEANTIRHGHMPNVNDMLMEMGMAADYAKIKETNANIMKIVTGAKEAKVTTEAGSNFTVTLDPNWKWVNCDGNIQADNWSNLPDGEVFTCARDINGKVVIDGVLGDFMNAKYGEISASPVVCEIKDGRVISVICENNKDIENDILEYMKIDENANRIGEFAIGTNLGLERLVGNLLQDEKFPGVHIAMGHGYPEKTGSDWTSAAHLDMVIQKTTIEIDGKMIMKAGDFVI
ncbi:MAG: aminopeptidase [Pseudomonadota bacterium]